MNITNGSELREARLSAGLTLRELAALLRLSPANGANHVGRVERGVSTLHGPMAVACEYLLGVKR